MSCDFDIERLYTALDHKRESLGLSWSGVAKEIKDRYAKVASSTIKGIREKQSVEGDGGLQMLLWLGRSPESFMPGLKASRRHQLSQPRKSILRFDTQHTYRLLEAKRLEQGLTWNEVAEQVGGCSPNVLRHFKKGGRTSFPGIMRIARWLAVPAKDLTKESPW